MNYHFNAKTIEETRQFYQTLERWKEIVEFRKLHPLPYPVKNLFFGDSITEVWPLHEFFPNHNILNRGIRGDNVHGLYSRLEEDVFAYRPQRVFLMAGINGIESPETCECLKELATIIKKRGIEIFCCSILPLRHPDQWNRFQYQDKITAINHELAQWTATHANGFVDYHRTMRDASGQLAAEYAQPDGTHLTFTGYRRMAETLQPYLVK